MAVVPEFPIVAIMEETQIPNRTYKLDIDKGRIIGFVDNEDAINQAAFKALFTPRFDCYAYDDQYGSELAALLRNPYATSEYVEAESEFMLDDALCADGRFIGINGLAMEINGDEAHFSFNVDTILGTMQIEGAMDRV